MIRMMKEKILKLKMRISTICIIIFIFCFSITIHEFGHFYMAKNFNIGVKEFSIGLGPELYSIQKNETIYSLKLIPYGGYNRFYSKDKKDPIPENKIYMKDASYDKQLLILIAGIAFNFIFGLLFLFIFTIKLGIPEEVDTDRKENESKEEFINRIRKEYLLLKYKKVKLIDTLKFVIKKILNIPSNVIDSVKTNSINNNIHNINCISDLIIIIESLLKNNKFHITFFIGIINISLGIFNILPIIPLDGGKFILVILHEIFGQNKYFDIAFAVISCSILAFIMYLDFGKDLGKMIFAKYKIVKRKYVSKNENS